MARRLIKEIEARRAVENPTHGLVVGLEAAVEAARALENSAHHNDNAGVPRGFTLPRAEQYSSLTVSVLRTLIRKGELFADKYGGQRYVILREDLDAYLTKKRNEAMRKRDAGKPVRES